MLAALLAVMMGMFAVAAIEVEQVRGNRFFPFTGALRFAMRRLSQILYSELAIISFVVSIVLLFAFLGLVSRIPVIGEWLYGLLFVFPSFIISIFTVFIIMVLAVSLLLMPAVAAAERKGETFGTILETFSTIIRQPWRWLGFTAFSAVAAKLCGFIYAYFCFRSVQFLVWSSGLGGGPHLQQMVRDGLRQLPGDSELVRGTFNVFPGLDWSFDIGPWLHGGSDNAVGYLMAAMLFLVFASIFGYMVAIVATAQARGYMVIRFVKDGHRLSEEQSLFFTDEPVNPKIDEGEATN
jgi:hypothetical protein